MITWATIKDNKQQQHKKRKQQKCNQQLYQNYNHLEKANFGDELTKTIRKKHRPYNQNRDQLRKHK